MADDIDKIYAGFFQYRMRKPKATPLMVSSFTDETQLMEWWLNHGDNLNARAESGATALHYAITQKKDNAIDILLKYNANPNIPLLRNSPYFKEHGIHIGDTALHTAVILSQIETVKKLIAHGAKIDCVFDIHTPLTYAIINNEIEMVKLLIQLGADVTKHTRKGRTPLSTAVALGNIEIVDLLLKKGADINENNLTEDTPVPSYSEDTINKRLLTPLMIAARNNDINMAQFLINAGADINALTVAGASALVYALKHKHIEMALLLLAHGADVNIGIISEFHAPFVMGDTPLHIAACYDDVELVRLMKLNQAQLDKTNIKGQKPIDVAGPNAKKELEFILKEQSKPVALTNTPTESALDRAKRLGWSYIKEASIFNDKKIDSSPQIESKKGQTLS